MPVSSHTNTQTACYHCGEDCTDNDISLQDKIFCCQGCKMVYEILHQYDLCEYYDLNSQPGINQRISVRRDKFAFLDDEKIAQQLYRYKDDTQTHVNFYIPQIHCSSCLWLLENLPVCGSAAAERVFALVRREVAEGRKGMDTETVKNLAIMKNLTRFEDHLKA